MYASIRTLVLISVILFFWGCSISHQPSIPSDQAAITDNSATLDKCPPESAADNLSSVSDNSPESYADSNKVETAPSDIYLDEKTGIGSATTEKTAQSLLDEALEFYQTSQHFFQKGEPDNALEALDQSYSLILKVDTEDDPKLIQQKDDLRILISKRIQEIYASRFTVANGNGHEIPMDLNEHVLKEIKSFQNREKKNFLAAYKRSGKYRERIIKALEENGMPTKLSWLPLIESEFKVRALSSARALGLWQFIPSTGYKFGLTRNTFIDERLDPEKATAAAIAYMTELHQIFGDWMTVLAAYNCGEGRVLRVIRGQNVNYLDNFWDLYQLLPLETARYVPRFLATLHILEDPEKYGFELPEPDPPLAFETVQVSRQVDLRGISEELNIPENELKALNPELRYGLLPAEPYTLRMPPGRGEVLLASIDRIAVSHPPQAAFTKHRIRSGETLSTIARRYHTSVSKIMRANNLRRSDYIVAGRTLKIPLRGTYTPSATTATASKVSAAVPAFHTVKRGDSLWIIARNYGTTVKRIQALNGLATTTLSIGQKLKISEKETTTLPGTANNTDTKSLRTYVVKRGDSPFTIARENHTTLERLLQLNQLSKRSIIYPGQTLYLD